MKIQEPCLECMLRQVIQLMNRFDVQNREQVYREVFLEMARIDYQDSSPVMWGNVYRIIKKWLGTEDPYQDIRELYDSYLMKEADAFRQRIREEKQPFRYAVKLAIAGNLIDFAADREPNRELILHTLREAENMHLRIDETEQLKEKIARAESLLFLGDNCGEIVLDRLLIEECLRINPRLKTAYAVKGSAVVNDVTEEEAYRIGMDEVAEILPNGDDAAGTVLNRVSPDFLNRYRTADVVIAKGQGNYESVSEDPNREVFCLLMAKCPHLAESFKVQPRSALCVRLTDTSERV